MKELINNDVSFFNLSLKDLSLKDFSRLEKLRKNLLERKTEICIERACLITQYLKEYADDKDSEIVRRAKSINFYLSFRKPVFFDDNILAGTTASKALSAPLYPEFIGLTIWPELETISIRENNPQKLTLSEADVLNFEIFPYWMERNVLEVARKNSKNPVAFDLMQRVLFFISGKAGCISHTVPCYEKVIKRGIDDIIAEAKKSAQECRDKDRAARDFYRAVEIVLEGVLSYVKNLEGEAKKRAEEACDLKVKQNFLRMANVLKNVPQKGAKTFIEAVSSLWICHIAVHAENINMAISPGRLDQILFEFYKRDREEGRISVEEAIEIVGCLFLKISDNVNMVPNVSQELFGGAGTAPAVTVGGVDKNGLDAVNELTYIMLKVTEMLKIREPNMNARYHYGVNSEAYCESVSRVIALTKAVPAFHNDVENIKTLMNQGVSIEHARDYSIIGCVELAESGRGYQASSSIILNLVTPLLLTLYDGVLPVAARERISPQTGKLEKFLNFDDFFIAYKKQLGWVISQAVSINEELGKAHQQVLPTPLLSAMFEGPMEKGIDLIFGGALYNSSGATHVGFTDVVDSLCAISDVVFVKRKFTFNEILAGMDGNFEGEFAGIGGYLAIKCPKYGSNSEIAEKISRELIEFLYFTYQKYINYRGGKYRPAYWTMTNHAGQGRITVALPNGRKKGMPFASGITPASNSCENVTDALKAVSKLGSLNIPGGEALNIKFSNINSEDELKKLVALVKGYFKLGGQQVQFNIMDYKMLRDAKKNPGKYRELMVRVSGYSAYFNDLNEAMKDELISRAQYEINSGKYMSL